MKIDVGDGVRLFADVDGAEWVPDGARMRRRPVLVLLHGGPGMDHSSFKLELDSLREIAQLVFIDHRGNGRSDDGPREKWNLDQWGDDVRSVCEVLGIESPVVMGQSFGGFVAQAYATRHPEHPAALILSSTSPTKNLERNLAVFERLGGERARPEKTIEAGGDRYPTPDSVLAGWPKEFNALADKIYSDFNKEQGTDYKFQLKK